MYGQCLKIELGWGCVVLSVSFHFMGGKTESSKKCQVGRDEIDNERWAIWEGAWKSPLPSCKRAILLEGVQAAEIGTPKPGWEQAMEDGNPRDNDDDGKESPTRDIPRDGDVANGSSFTILSLLLLWGLSVRIVDIARVRLMFGAQFCFLFWKLFLKIAF